MVITTVITSVKMARLCTCAKDEDPRVSDRFARRLRHPPPPRPSPQVGCARRQEGPGRAMEAPRLLCPRGGRRCVGAFRSPARVTKLPTWLATQVGKGRSTHVGTPQPMGTDREPTQSWLTSLDSAARAECRPEAVRCKPNKASKAGRSCTGQHGGAVDRAPLLLRPGPVLQGLRVRQPGGVHAHPWSGRDPRDAVLNGPRRA